MDVLLAFLVGAILYPLIDRILAGRRRLRLSERLEALERTCPSLEERNRAAVEHFEQEQTRKSWLILLVSLPFLLLLLGRGIGQ